MPAGCFPWQQERAPPWMSACRDPLTQDWHRGLGCAQHWVLFPPHASCSLPRRVPEPQQDIRNCSALPVLMIFRPWSGSVPPSGPVGGVTGTRPSQHAALLPLSAREGQLCPGSALPCKELQPASLDAGFGWRVGMGMAWTRPQGLCVLEVAAHP